MLKRLSSSYITVICLTLLLILTFWGTVAQVQQGLYAAQERFFNSFFFLAGGFLPFPGAQLVLWILFINLVCMTILTFKKYSQWINLGLLITHLGLLLYFVAAFMVFHVSQESSIHLAVGQKTNVALSYHDWEIAYWSGQGMERQVTSLDVLHFKPAVKIPFVVPAVELTVKEFYSNSAAFTGTKSIASSVLNGSGITRIEAKPLLKQNEQNVPGGVFDLKFHDSAYNLILFGGDDRPTAVTLGDRTYYFILRHKTYPLPFTLTLNEFKAEFLPGTSMAKNYESNVTIDTGTLKRQARIYMNNPLKYKDYTVYQSSYDTDSSGRQYSTFAVVKNFAKILLYIACLVVFLGLALHFLIQAFRAKRE